MSQELELEPGPYFISSVSFETGQPVTRFLGQSIDHPDAINVPIVVLPVGSPAHKWNIVKHSNDTYLIYFRERIAAVIGGSLVLTHHKIAFPWKILRGAPSPPPIGKNNFGIFVPDQQPQESWFIENTGGSPAVEVPVTIGDVASSIVIDPAYKE